VNKEPTPESFLPLKPHWFHVLLSLANDDQHGYGIMQEVLDRTDGKVRLWPPTLYGTIKRLIEAGLIEESDKRPDAELDDARRRYYRLTALGRRVLAAECARLEDLVRVIRSKRGLKPRRVE
jgi:DNA-binding PadR family transcriptional regulator